MRPILSLSVLKFFKAIADVDQDVHAGGLPAKIVGRAVMLHELF